MSVGGTWWSVLAATSKIPLENQQMYSPFRNSVLLLKLHIRSLPVCRKILDCSELGCKAAGRHTFEMDVQQGCWVDRKSPSSFAQTKTIPSQTELVIDLFYLLVWELQDRDFGSDKRNRVNSEMWPKPTIERLCVEIIDDQFGPDLCY